MNSTGTQVEGLSHCVTTVHSLPPEILLEIFQNVWNISKRTRRAKDYHEDILAPTHMPDSIADVCVHWDAVMAMEPKFWESQESSYADVVISLLAPSPAKRLQIHFERNTKPHLRIIIYGEDDANHNSTRPALEIARGEFGDAWEELEANRMSQVAEVLSKNFHRLSDLAIHTQFHSSLPLWQDFVPSDPANEEALSLIKISAMSPRPHTPLKSKPHPTTVPHSTDVPHIRGLLKRMRLVGGAFVWHAKQCIRSDGDNSAFLGGGEGWQSGTKLSICGTAFDDGGRARGVPITVHEVLSYTRHKSHGLGQWERVEVCGNDLIQIEESTTHGEDSQSFCSLCPSPEAPNFSALKVMVFKRVNGSLILSLLHTFHVRDDCPRAFAASSNLPKILLWYCHVKDADDGRPPIQATPKQGIIPVEWLSLWGYHSEDQCPFVKRLLSMVEATRINWLDCSVGVHEDAWNFLRTVRRPDGHILQRRMTGMEVYSNVIKEGTDALVQYQKFRSDPLVNWEPESEISPRDTWASSLPPLGRAVPLTIHPRV